MRLRTLLAAAAVLASAAVGSGAREATAAAPAARMNVAPVANITYVSSRPMWTTPSSWWMRHKFSSAGSYDPDGSIASYYWTTSCTNNPDGHSSTYQVDVLPGATCLVDLWVYDNEGAWGHQQISVTEDPYE